MKAVEVFIAKLLLIIPMLVSLNSVKLIYHQIHNRDKDHVFCGLELVQTLVKHTQTREGKED